MSSIARPTTFALLTLLAAAGAALPEEPLPHGAAVRFGSTRFLFDGWVTDVAYAPDGRTLITGAVHKSGPLAGQSRLVFWDAATGAKRYESDPEKGQLWNVVTAPDGRTVATYFTSKRQFTLYDATNGKLLREMGEKSRGAPVYSPDSKRLAGAIGNDVQVWEVATGEEVLRLEGHSAGVTWLAYSPDGRLLASVAGDHSLRVWDLDSGEILLQQEDEERRWSFVDFTADGRSVGATTLVRNDAHQACHLVLWDVAGGHETLRVPVAADAQGFIFTPDGKRLILVELNAAEVREAGSGKLIRRFSLGGPARSRSWMIARDGNTLATGASGSTVLQWDLTTGVIKDAGPGHRFPIQAVAVAADGRSVLTQDSGGDVRLWDPATGRELRRFQAPKDAVGGLPFAPNGHAPYYCCAAEDGALRLVDVETGRERSQLKDVGSEMRSMMTSTDGALLALLVLNAEGAAEVGVWDSATGKKRKSMEKASPDLLTIALSGDGKRLAGASAESIRLWDAATGRELRSIALDKEMNVNALRFSADGRRLLAIGQETALGVWETDSGRQVLSTRIKGASIFTAALSPDGRTVVVSSLEERGGPTAFILLETATGLERCRVSGHFRSDVDVAQYTPHDVTFTPDGRSLITTGTDTTALVWSLPFRAADVEVPRRAADLPPLWDALADADAARAYRAHAALVAAADRAVPLLRERLRPVTPFDEKARAQIGRWIADLDNDEFTTREKAAAELEKLEELAAPALRRVMDNEPSAEVKRHLTRLLDRLAVHPPAAEVLRALRAVETLERIATPDALKLLDELARGAPEAYRTREAVEALSRLKGRKGK